MKRNLKLFVWEGVLADYSAGIMFALAPDVETARNMLREQLGYDHDDLKQEPKEYTDTVAYLVYGGG